jgi:cardiolipin synthase
VSVAARQPLALEVGAMERALDRVSGGRAIPGNDIRYLTDGPAAFAVMEEAIAHAERWVHFENYIINADHTGRRFAAALTAAAARGVTVRVLYDYFGCRGTPAPFWKQLRQGGVQVRVFNPVKLFRPLESIQRNHRKYVSADGRLAIVGGLCIGDEWAGDPARKRLPWRDTAVQVLGPAVSVLDLSFAHTWSLTGQPTEEVRTPPNEPRGGAMARVIEGIPGQLRVYRTMELLAAGAAERLWITDAYLLPPQAMLSALIAAARDGLDVRLLVPGRSDIPPLSALSRVGYRELLEAGARIWEWRGPMLHAKTVIVDSKWFKVGSSNLNASSLRRNYELDLLIEDERVTADAVRQFHKDLSRSVEVVLRRPRWAKGRLAERLPPVARRAIPVGEVDPDHEPSPEERSRRAVVYLRQVASGARRSIAGATVFALIGTGVLFLTLPKVMATILAVACFWLGGSAAWHFYQRRRLSTDE